jgi:hypothetical protein
MGDLAPTASAGLYQTDMDPLYALMLDVKREIKEPAKCGVPGTARDPDKMELIAKPWSGPHDDEPATHPQEHLTPVPNRRGPACNSSTAIRSPIQNIVCALLRPQQTRL